MFEARVQKLYSAIGRRGMTGAVVNAGPTLTYLTGLHFHLMERPVVVVFVPGRNPTIILPKLEERKLEQLSYDMRAYTYDDNPKGWAKVFKDGLDGCGLHGARVGVEPGQMRLLEYNYLREAANAEYLDGSELFADLRAVKDADEITRMRKAVQIAENALEATLPMVKIGVSEKEIAGELFIQLMRHGSDGELPFSPIIAAGPNGANPHATPTERQLAAGDLLIVDWGAAYDGYAADLTRTFAIGEIDAKAREIHTVVQQANEAGRKAGRPGIACAEVDQAARQVIEDAGYGQFFTHRTGHGIGMECHENPYIHGQNNELLIEGNAYTIEPGIYLAGENGVRIEDDVVVTADGAESLSTMSREIRVLG
ncbi:M24 family metallopeptidase [Desulfopila aestuarii]|uniref:Xaa-Pro dipeptidase n=1 Tax=Desulfopila aestuarii DSM 18488 TaxID=1121416 RepID=A0A1M7YB32_9BACT|nr:Xaa-Pro peptidase family protein [Desulfopila aestuarii]SHO49860.1 Xaa-Pro dipeptidase [Desulfopila aestuarii DSM 18488]